MEAMITAHAYLIVTEETGCLCGGPTLACTRWQSHRGSSTQGLDPLRANLADRASPLIFAHPAEIQISYDRTIILVRTTRPSSSSSGYLCMAFDVYFNQTSSLHAMTVVHDE